MIATDGTAYRRMLKTQNPGFILRQAPRSRNINGLHLMVSPSNQGNTAF